MSLTRFQNLIGSARYKKAVNQDTNLSLELESKSKPLNEYDIIDIVNLYDLYSDEREKSSTYRFNGKINVYTANVLSTGATIYVNGKPDDSVWSPMFYGNPPVSPSNWVMQVLYPSDSLSDFLIKYQPSKTQNPQIISKAYRGVQYKNFTATVINNSRYLSVTGVQNHNLNPDDYVYIYSDQNTLQGIFRVLNLGVDTDAKKDFVLDISLDTTFVPTGSQPYIYYNALPTGWGNFIKINNPSFDDINYVDPKVFTFGTTSDISGNTLGGYTVNEEKYLTITTNQPHNLKVNNYVDVRTNPGDNLNGVWKVYNTLGGTGSTKFVIRIDLGITTKGTTVTPSTNRQFRVLDGIPSEYYVRKFEVLTSNGYEVYPCSFSVNIYPETKDITLGVANKTWLFHYNEDVDISRLKTNRKGPITELYYSIIKRSGKNPYNWSNVISNWDFNIKKTTPLNGIENISINNSTNIGTVEKSNPRKEYVDTDGQINFIPGDKYIVDFVEFNPSTLIETPLSTVNHMFTGPSTTATVEGYYYNPYKKLEIKAYSSTINVASANETVVDIPENYVSYADGSIAWKNLLPIGYSEDGSNAIDYPFLNNANYFYFDFNLFVRRQGNTLSDSNRRRRDNLNYVSPDQINSEC
jgi:hypothetical protein